MEDQPLNHAATARPSTRIRYRVLVMLCLLTFILYLDRVCISQAAKAIETDLQISHFAMGFVFGAFTLAYGLFEIPTGHWGDRYGSRGVLTRIVLWWSVFTVLTGVAVGVVMMVSVRFLFGAGEAGALPNAARVVARWFPAHARGPAQGTVITSALVGGALAPLLTEMLLHNIGWRWTFGVLGIPGILWAVVFYWWYRDDPAHHPQVNDTERRYIAGPAPPPVLATPHPPVPWGIVLRSANIWLLGGVVTCGAFNTYLFFFWYPTYMQEARHVSPLEASQMAGLILAGGAVGSLLGGVLSDWLVRTLPSRRWCRSGIGCCALGSGGVAMVTSIYLDDPWQATLLAAWACLAIHFQLASWWGAVTEVSGKHLGALFGLMNSLGVPGAFVSPIFLGWFVDWLGSLGYTSRAQWDPAFYVYGCVLATGAVCWLFVDVTKSAVE